MNREKKQMKEQAIKDAARKLIIGSSIDKTTFSQIASEAGVGEATIYRYFPNKGELTQSIAIDYLNDVHNELKTIMAENEYSDLSRMEKLIDYYIDLFENKPDYYIFLEKFDNFLINCDQYPSQFNHYESLFEDIKRIGFAKEGLDDNKSLRLAEHTFSINFVTHCQKLLLRGQIVSDDKDHEHIDELKLLKNVYLNYIKANYKQGEE